MDDANNILRPSNFLTPRLSPTIRDCLSQRNLGSSQDPQNPMSKLKEMSSDFVLKIKAEQKKHSAFKEPGFAITTAPNCKCKNILIVDDEEFNLKATSNILVVMDPGISFFTAKDGDEAVELCHQLSDSNTCKNCDFFRLIIMDINMPKLGGFEATQQILARNRQKMEDSGIAQGILVLGCTAYTDNNTKVEGKKIGMEYVMCKPYKRRHFVEAFMEIGLLDEEVMGMLTPLKIGNIKRSGTTLVEPQLTGLVDEQDRLGSTELIEFGGEK
jgi:CheY-like chemotaxis protein